MRLTALFQIKDIYPLTAYNRTKIRYLFKFYFPKSYLLSFSQKFENFIKKLKILLRLKVYFNYSFLHTVKLKKSK